ncbi:helix-turn-helix transcriptional regulator [Roseovarius sp.]|uniref:helix-turn-helix transcriptional regulator n=1 Tax=Roseovarius sp. TaxID=1486281 RepID=UPI003BAA0818
MLASEVDLDAHALLPPRQAARYLGLSESTLAKLRSRHARGRGPRYSKLGGSIRYRKTDLDAWIAENATRSPGQAPDVLAVRDDAER